MNLCLNLALSWVGKRVFVPPTAPTAVSFQSLTANGTSGTVSTTQLTATFDIDPGLTTANFVVTGASKGSVSKVDNVYTINIHTITVEDGQNVTLAVTNPAGYSVTPSSRSVAVNVALEDVLFLKTYESDLTAELLPTFNYLPLDANGWSTFQPSADSLVIYVNNSTGNDSTATPYTYGDGSAFTDWFDDEGQTAYATLEAAWTQLRSGFPDYIVCRNGQIHNITTTLDMVAGRSLSERLIITSYGDGFKAHINQAGAAHIAINAWENVSYWAIIGVRGTDTRRDPDSPDYLGDLLNYNARFLAVNAFATGHIKGALIEDCEFPYIAAMTSALFLFRGQISDFIFRRNVVYEAYSVSGGHQQGMYLDGGGFLIEENFFDHNGWSTAAALIADAPTEFSHNLYASHIAKTVVRNNIFTRAASMGIKLTANSSPLQLATALTGVETELEVLENLRDDFPTEGEFLLRTSLNSGDVGYKETPITFTARTGNVFTIDYDFTEDPYEFAAYASVTFNYTSSFDIDMNGNLLLDNEIGISYGGNAQNDFDDIYPRFKNLRVQGNTLTEVGNSQIQGSGRVVSWALQCSDNEDTITSENLILKTTNPAVTDQTATRGAGYQVNTQQFNNISNQGPFTAISAYKYGNAFGLSSEDFVNADADTLTYLASIGETATYESFYARIRQQRKGNWDERYTAAAIDAYLRKQFALVDEIKVLQDATDVSALDGNQAFLFFDVIANTRTTAQWYLSADDSPVDGFTKHKQPVVPSDPPNSYYCIVTDERGNSVTSSTVSVSIISPDNKLTNTEDFSNAAWIKDLCTITDVNLMTGSSTNGEQRVRQTVAITGAPEVLSIEVKPETGRYFGFRATESGSVYTPRFDLEEGLYLGGIGGGATLVPFIEPAEDGYYRVGVIFQNRTSTSCNFNILSGVAPFQTVVNDGDTFRIRRPLLTDGGELQPYVAG